MTIHNLEGNFDQLWKDQSWGSYTEWPHFRSSILIYSTLLSCFRQPWPLTLSFLTLQILQSSVKVLKRSVFASTQMDEKKKGPEICYFLLPESFRFHSQILGGNQQWAFEAPIWCLSAVKWSFLFFFLFVSGKLALASSTIGENIHSITCLVIGKMGKPLGQGRKQHMQTIYHYVES